MRKLTHNEIVARQDQKISQAERMPVCVVLNDIRSLFNVGSIFRTADGVGIEKIWLCGITGAPPQMQISKTALGAEEHVDWAYAHNPIPILQGLKQAGYEIVILEQTDESIPYEDYQPKFPTCLVVGNEVEGISPEVAALCDKAVEIEMTGRKNSLNVSVAFGIMVYDLRRRYKAGCLPIPHP